MKAVCPVVRLVLTLGTAATFLLGLFPDPVMNFAFLSPALVQKGLESGTL